MPQPEFGINHRSETPPQSDGVASSSDCAPFEAGELQLIEDALRNLRSIKEGEIEESKAVEQHNLSSSNDLQDVAMLLKKVQAVKAGKKGASLQHTNSSLDTSFGQGPAGGDSMEPVDIRQVIQAAAQTALAAAKTAETVVSSLDRNSQAMEELCKALTSSNSLQTSIEETGMAAEDEDREKFLAMELKQTEIAKSLVRQNRVTHWVLGFIVASSLLWRYGVVKFVKRVNNTIQNPFQGFTEMFKPKEEKDNNGPQFKLPGILGGDEEAHAGKEKEGFDLGDIFPGQQPKERKDASEAKEENNFDLRNIFSGQQPKEKKDAAKEREDKKFDLGKIFSGQQLGERKDAVEKEHKKFDVGKSRVNN